MRIPERRSGKLIDELKPANVTTKSDGKLTFSQLVSGKYLISLRASGLAGFRPHPSNPAISITQTALSRKVTIVSGTR
jgi:hypothetical protein